MAYRIARSVVDHLSRALAGSPSTPRKGLDRLYATAATTMGFRIKLAARNVYYGTHWTTGAVARQLEAATFVASVGWYHAPGAARINQDGRLELVGSPRFARTPLLGRAAMQHEIIHVLQHAEWGALKLEADGTLSLRAWARAEVDAMCWGSPEIMVLIVAAVLALVHLAA